jgi:hypothetical protein
MLLRETVAHNIDKGHDVFICFLDAQKAFDTVWINGLLYKLIEANIDPKLCRVFKDMYDNFRCTVKIGNDFSDWINIYQGVQQGAPLSMWAYQMYINELLIEIEKSKLGAKINNISICCPAYADDIALIALSNGKLQSLMDIAYDYSKKWRFTYNANKSEVMCYGKDKNQKEQTFWLGRNMVNVSNSCQHLGTTMSSSKKQSEKSVSDCIYRCKQAFYSLLGLGSRRVPAGVLLLSKLYWSICIPTLTYGCEVLTYTEQSKQSMEKVHWEICKVIQKLPKQTPNPCVLQQLKWMNVLGYIDMLKLTFLWNVLNMSEFCLYKRVAFNRLLSFMVADELQTEHFQSPIFECLRTAKRYGLFNYYIRNVFYGQKFSNNRFKTLVKEKIRSYERQQHEITLKMYKRPLYEDCVKPERILPWFVHASKYPEQNYKCIKMLRLIIDDEQVKSCQCEIVIVKNWHILFECPCLNEKRSVMWNELEKYIPIAMWSDLNKMSSIEKSKYIMSGFNSGYIKEFHETYKYMLLYVCDLFEEYNKLSMEIDTTV